VSMKPRTEKKLSKKLARILRNVRGFTDKDVWIDSELELYTRHYNWRNEGRLTSKQKRQNYERRVRVNHMPSVGGGVDYWGEGEDHYSVFYAATEMLCWEMFECEPVNLDDLSGGYPKITMKLTGKNVIALARAYASKVKQSEKAGAA
jgi:hypothetical protein